MGIISLPDDFDHEIKWLSSTHTFYFPHEILADWKRDLFLILSQSLGPSRCRLIIYFIYWKRIEKIETGTKSVRRKRFCRFEQTEHTKNISAERSVQRKLNSFFLVNITGCTVRRLVFWFLLYRIYSVVFEHKHQSNNKNR